MWSTELFTQHAKVNTVNRVLCSNYIGDIVLMTRVTSVDPKQPEHMCRLIRSMLTSTLTDLPANNVHTNQTVWMQRLS